MLRDILAAAARNLAANRLYAGISVAGLALGLAAVILTGLYIRSELSYDRFIPGHERAFVVTSDLRMPGQAPVVTDYAPGWIAGEIQRTVPQARATARLAYDEVSLRHGEIEAREDLAWVDPAFFDILPLPPLAGDPRRTMDDPNGVVITRAVARKYFGRDAPVGETLELDGAHLLRIGAVIKDLPGETHLSQQVFASGKAAFSRLAQLEARSKLEAHSNAPRGFASWLVTPTPDRQPSVRFETVRLRTYVALADGRRIKGASERVAGLDRTMGAREGLPEGSRMTLTLTPLSDLHLQAFKGANLGVGDVRTSRGALVGLATAAGLVLALAIINFVNLTTARAARRALEVGVRKAAGARRGHLIALFIGEAALQALIAMVLALAVVDLSLPALNAFLGKSMTFPYWRDPLILGGLATGAAVLAVAAGAYPAFVLSAFRPASVLKGGPLEAGGSGLVRQGLVVIQFVVLILLILAATVVWRQTSYAMGAGLKMDKDQVLAVRMTPCRTAFEAEVRRLPGVTGAACSSVNLLELDNFDPVKFVMEAKVAGGPSISADFGAVDYGWFELYGVRPIAGRLFSRDHHGDEQLPFSPTGGGLQHGAIVLNRAAVRSLGLASPQAALGRTLEVGPGMGEFEIVGVTPDVTLDLKSARVKPTFFLVDFANYPADLVLSIKLDGARIPSTVAAIDRLWRASGQPGAIHQQFLDDYVQQLYLGTIRQGFLVSMLCGLALLLACLGLLGLAAFTAERRTKEIGVRKAMGASDADILSLLLWRFTRPVLIAWAIAAPLGWLMARRWLDGFAYRVDLSLWMFAGAGAAAVVIAWLTVGAHAWAITRRQPAHALRYE